jgi:hypothetical protein
LLSHAIAGVIQLAGVDSSARGEYIQYKKKKFTKIISDACGKNVNIR